MRRFPRHVIATRWRYVHVIPNKPETTADSDRGHRLIMAEYSRSWQQLERIRHELRLAVIHTDIGINARRGAC